MNDDISEEIRFKKLLCLFSLFILICILSIGLLFLCSCQYLPQVMDSVEKIADNDAITIKADKDCFQKSTDVRITVDVINKDKEESK